MTLARRVVLLGAAAYLVTLVVVPVLNPALDVGRLHPEDYAGATGGLLVNLGYVALGAAALALAFVAWRAGGWLGWVAAASFLAGAVTCAANAIDPTLGTQRSPVELGVFGLVFGPIALSARLRRRPASVLAVLVAAAFLALIVFGSGEVGGIVNRVFDALVALWCIVVAASRPPERGIMRMSGEVA